MHISCFNRLFFIILAAKTCGENEFQCLTGSCIPDSWVCDSFPDCRTGSNDEDLELCSKCLKFINMKSLLVKRDILTWFIRMRYIILSKFEYDNFISLLFTYVELGI